MFDVSTADADRSRLLLKLIGVLALIDVFLLVPLALGRLDVVDSESWVSIIGPTHGTVFMVLVGLTVWGKVQGRWNWTFPGAVVVANGVIFVGLKAIDTDDPSIVWLLPVLVVMAVLIAVPLTADYLVKRELDAAEAAGR